MLKFLKYCCTTYLLIFFLLAGTGINMVHYCCDECRHAGLEHIVEHKCDAIHHHDHHHDCTCHHHGTCQFKHYMVSQAIIDAPQQLVQTIASNVLNVVYMPLNEAFISEYSLHFTTLPYRTIHVPIGRIVSILFCTYLL